jgi:hypothetical protein
MYHPERFFGRIKRLVKSPKSIEEGVARAYSMLLTTEYSMLLKTADADRETSQWRAGMLQELTGRGQLCMIPSYENDGAGRVARPLGRRAAVRFSDKQRQCIERMLLALCPEYAALREAYKRSKVQVMMHFWQPTDIVLTSLQQAMRLGNSSEGVQYQRASFAGLYFRTEQAEKNRVTANCHVLAEFKQPVAAVANAASSSAASASASAASSSASAAASAASSSAASAAASAASSSAASAAAGAASSSAASAAATRVYGAIQQFWEYRPWDHPASPKWLLAEVAWFEPCTGRNLEIGYPVFHKRRNDTYGKMAFWPLDRMVPVNVVLVQDPSCADQYMAVHLNHHYQE